MILSHMEWRTASRYSKYEVSEFGDVRRKKTQTRIPGFIDPDGYIRYGLLCDDGRSTSVAAHTLVLETFVGESPSTEHQVAHANGSRVHCHHSNLRWATCQENHDDIAFHGNRLNGSRHPKAKLTEADVVEIRKSYREIKLSKTRSVKELDSRFSISRNTILRIAKGHAWKHVPMPNTNLEMTIPCES